MNKVILTGRLTRDPESKYTQEGTCVTTFSLAVARYSEGADFISCVAWGNLAETCAIYLTKGKKILIEGRMQVRSYERDGTKRYVTEVIVNNMEFLEKKGASTANKGADAYIYDPVPMKEVPF